MSSFLRKVSKEEARRFGDPSKGPTGAAAPGDAKLADLVDQLEKGGGGGLEASKQLGTRRDAATAKAVARVLHSKKAIADARVLAARTLGEIALPESVKALAAEAGDDDFRVVDAVVLGLGRTALPEAAEPLVRAGKRLGQFWERFREGGHLGFTEYQVRLESFGALADAFAAVGDAEAALPVLEKQVVQPVFLPKTPYDIPVDERFTHIPPGARLELVRRLRAAFVKLGDPRGKALLESVRAAWQAEPALVRECEAAIADM